MYKYTKPTPIVIKLTDSWGYEMRVKASEYMNENKNITGAERGSDEEQGFGALAEIVIRSKLGMPIINPKDHPIACDLILPSGVTVDSKCRGGSLPFKEEYDSDDGIPREAKHNFFARQIHDDSLNTDIYLMSHLETPKDRVLPGTTRQKKWVLYICGWVSKDRVKREGVYLPRGSLTEQGKTWFTYRGQEIEFYNKNLNGLGDLRDMLTIDKEDVEKDTQKEESLNITSVDAIRIAYDLVGRGILKDSYIESIKKIVGLEKNIKPILNSNQYFHLLNYLRNKGIITNEEIKKARVTLQEIPYTGI